MMATETLNVHDIGVSDTTTFGPGANAIPKRKVTYFIGNHGPFELLYDKADATAARIKSDIQAHVAELQDISSLTS